LPRINVDLHRNSALRAKLVEHGAHACRSARAEVVRLARDALLEKRQVASHHVSDVAEVALDLQVPDPQPLRAGPGFGGRQRAGELRADEVVRLAGPGVVERSSAYDVERMGPEELERGKIRRRLRYTVWRQPPQRLTFDEWKV